MNKFLRMVMDFHLTFKHPVKDEPLIPDNRKDLRVNLLQEEVKEFAEACAKGDIVEAADALCDIQYVLSGAVLEFGLKDKFDEMFQAVHESNMSKACLTEAEAKETVAHWEEKEGEKCHYVQDEDSGMFLVYRDKDMKTMKSINYAPVDWSQFRLEA